MAKLGSARPKFATGAAVGLAIVFGVSGCADPAVNPAAEPAVTETVTETVTEAPELVETDSLGGPLTSDPEAAEDLVVTDIALTAEGDLDRATLTLAGSGQPGYRVEWVDQAVQDGSGFVHDTGDDRVLLVTLTGMTFPLDVDATEFAGTVEFEPGDGSAPVEMSRLPFINQVIYDAWFEGAVRIFITVDPDVVDPAFTVTRLADPTRVLIDVAPAAAYAD